MREVTSGSSAAASAASPPRKRGLDGRRGRSWPPRSPSAGERAAAAGHLDAVRDGACLHTTGMGRLAEAVWGDYINLMRRTPAKMMKTARRRWTSIAASLRVAPSRGPESKGECRDGACVLISEKTHVFDSANRPWLLPFIAEKATGAERDLLLTLIRHASAHQPEHRPSFC